MSGADTLMRDTMRLPNQGPRQTCSGVLAGLSQFRPVMTVVWRGEYLNDYSSCMFWSRTRHASLSIFVYRPRAWKEHLKSVVVLQRCYLIFCAWTLSEILHIVEHVSHCFVICKQLVTTLLEDLQHVCQLRIFVPSASLLSGEASQSWHLVYMLVVGCEVLLSLVTYFVFPNFSR